MRKTVIPLLCIISLIGLQLFPYGKKGLFKRIGVEEGLSENSVNVILQDQFGFIWIGTDNGLNRYDGQQFVIIRRNPGSGLSLSDSNVLSLAEDSSGNLWIGTVNGLNYYDRFGNQISAIPLTQKNQGYEANSYINALQIDSTGFLWVGTADGLIQKQPSDTEFIRYPIDPDGRKGPPHEHIQTIFEDSSRQIWIGSQEGLCRYDSASRLFTLVTPATEQNKSLGASEINVVTEDRQGQLWIGTKNGLNRLEPDQDHFTAFPLLTEQTENWRHNPVTALQVDTEDILWVGTDQGLFRISPDRKAITLYRSSIMDPYTLSDNTVSGLFEDRSGLIWAGGDKGLNLFDKTREAFGHIYHNPQESASLGNSNVLTVFTDKEKRLWIGSDGGLDLGNKEGIIVRHFGTNLDDIRSLSNPYVRAICQDTKDRFWVGTYYGENPGLHLLDPERGVIEFYGQSAEFPNSHVMGLNADPDGTIWIATMGGGLFNFDPDRKRFIRYQQDESEGCLPDNWLYALFRDTQGALWIASDSGLFGFDPLQKKFFPFLSPQETDQNSRIRSLCQDLQGRYWLAGEDGLTYVDKKAGQVKKYTEGNGLAANMVLSVLCDHSGDIWAGTSKGISCYQIKTNTFRNFDFHDGLFNSTFNINSCDISPDGLLYFGGKNGLNIIDPNRVGCNQNPPAVAITTWRKGNVELPLDPWNNQEITVSHRDHQLNFDFSVLHFSRPEKNRYSYMLQGLDNTWINAGTRHSAGFSDLSPGQYRLLVKGATPCGRWNEAGAALTITVLPPFWQTWWFRLAFTFSSLLLLFAGYRWRIRTMLHRQQELESIVDKRTREIAHKEELYRSLIDTSPDAIMMTDMEGTIIMANQQAASLYGLEDSLEMIGQNAFAFFDGNQIQLESMNKQLRESGGVRNIRFYIRKTDGQAIPAEMNATVISGEEFRPFSLIAVIRDITEQKTLEEKLRHLAATDSLTGINNLHRFLERANDEIIRALRYQKPLSFLMIDLDHFKSINDTYGHPTGDEVLKTMTTHCQTLLRQNDVFGRLGGEEFGVLLIETGLIQAQEIAERLRAKIEYLSIPTEKGAAGITVSIGLTVLAPPNRASWEALLHDADQALYQAKAQGRNRVVSLA